MAIGPGSRLGPYEVTALIGEGGMGKVWRAHHTGLQRDDALKVLPEAFASDQDRLARFRREAQLLASLNHPNIAHVHGLEHADGVQALVMELVEGPTLADRIALGPIPVDEALPIARQIAEALEAAHEHGIIHRDLKPANIKVRDDGTVKVLDFGLAKALGGDVLAADASLSPTLSVATTRAGVILGTAAYMSPEQARGKNADKRSDIWAFGCVLFEMLAGKRVFDGEGMTDVLARVLEREPDWTALPAKTPPPIRALLKRCLEKDRRKRVADVSTALFVIDDHLNFAPAQEPQQDGYIPKHVAESQANAAITAIRSQFAQSTRRRVAAVGAVALSLGAIATTAVWVATRSTSMPVTRLVIPTSGTAALSVDGSDRDLSITPDGTRVIYRGTNQLFARALDELEPTALTAPGGAPRSIFVSPDGQWVGFVDGAGTSPLKKVAISGGPAVTLTKTDAASRGATWGEDGTIVYATGSGATGLHRVSSAGGAAAVITTPDLKRGEADHLWPEFLPGGQALLFTITASTGGLDNAQVALLDLGTGTYKTVLHGGHHARYVSTGHLVYGAGGTLRAAPFDLGRREVTGPPVLILDGVMTNPFGGIDVTVANSGAMVYVPDRGGIGAQRSLVWVDRMGREEPLPAPARRYIYPRISPDGARVALDIRDQEQDIWIWDIARQTLTRLTFDPRGANYPVWTPDSRRVLSQRPDGVYAQAVDGTGTRELITKIGAPYSMSADGTVLVMRVDAPQSGSDLLLLPLAPGTAAARERLAGLQRPVEGRAPPAGLSGGVSNAGGAQTLIGTMFSELNAELAPDGRWIAYQSNESGRYEIYVRPFPDVAGGRWQVSTAGGRTPLWGRGGELFYRSVDRALMRVQVERGAAFRSGPPTQVLPARYFDDTGTTGRTFDIAPDGQRFLMIKEGGEGAAPPQIVVVQNWFEELKRLVPTN